MWLPAWTPASTGQYFGRERRTMFRGMRRERQDLSETETIAMLRSCTAGVLAVHGDDDYPYAVP